MGEGVNPKVLRYEVFASERAEEVDAGQDLQAKHCLWAVCEPGSMMKRIEDVKKDANRRSLPGTSENNNLAYMN